MGCGTSKSVTVKEARRFPDDKVSNHDPTKPTKNGNLKPKNDVDTGPSSTFTYPNATRASENFLAGPVDSILLQGKTPGNMNLQERLKILSTRRRSLQFEIGRGDDSDINGDSSITNVDDDARIRRSSFKQPPTQDFPRRKSAFQPLTTRNGYSSSPVATRRKFSLTDSQIEFFRMLDEKVAQGKDYHSEDEKSISSLVSRNASNGKLATILDALRSQHAR